LGDSQSTKIKKLRGNQRDGISKEIKIKEVPLV
jgi:hypothetical protein